MIRKMFRGIRHDQQFQFSNLSNFSILLFLEFSLDLLEFFLCDWIEKDHENRQQHENGRKDDQGVFPIPARLPSASSKIRQSLRAAE
jgi:hypothetical protein